MYSITYGKVNFNKMCNIIHNYIKEQPWENYHITVGTDSQNFNKTKTVMVVAVHRVGKGGIFFYDTIYVDRIKNLKKKLFFETTQSLNLAIQLLDKIKQDNLSISIHVDAGYNGPTSKVIPEITAWVRSCGFDCCVKPLSYTASAIANKFTK